MSDSFDRKLKRTSEQLKPRPGPDAELGPMDALLRAAENGTFEQRVAEANAGTPPLKMITPEEREAALRAEGKWPLTNAASAPAAKPDHEPEPEQPLPGPLMPDTGRPWSEERAFWRPRRPSDHYWEQATPGKCLTEYDVLASDDDYDLFGDDDQE